MHITYDIGSVRLSKNESIRKEEISLLNKTFTNFIFEKSNCWNDFLVKGKLFPINAKHKDGRKLSELEHQNLKLEIENFFHKRKLCVTKKN